MNHEIDVALSYAGEQGGYVREVATELTQRGVVVFFAPFEETKLWGEDLIPYLQRVYRDLATLCVMFISKEYVEKAWPSHERHAVLARQLTEQAGYILPVRFDDSTVPGLSTTIHFVRAKDHPPAELAEMIIHKLRAARGSASQEETN